MISPAFLLVFILVYILIIIFKRINKKNKYQFIYLLLHFIARLFIIVSICLYITLKIKLSVFFISVVKLAALIFIFKHLQSVYLERYVKINITDKLLFTCLIIVNTLNHFGIKLTSFEYHIPMTGSIMDLSKFYFNGFEDVIIISTIIIIYYSVNIITVYVKITKNTAIKSKVRTTLLSFFYHYVLFYVLSSIFLSLHVNLILFKLITVEFILLQKIITIASLLILSATTFILKEISNTRISDKSEHSNIFKQIENHLMRTEAYLKPDYSISRLSIDTGIADYRLRKFMKETNGLTIPMYFNSLRIKHACSLISNGYLNKYTVNALVKECGFKKQQSFNRAFKTFCKVTPSEYFKVRNKIQNT